MVYILRTKDEVLEKFKEYVSFVETQFSSKVKNLRSDNGGEYTSKQFDDFCKSKGIVHELTVPRCPEQNGVVERFNRTLMESARSMLEHAQLPPSFWALAVDTAAYLRNRCPTEALDKKTPFEVWFGRKPNVNSLRIFGCHVLVHVDESERRKLDAKSKLGIFVGYAPNRKGYRYFDPETKRVPASRDMKFLETKFGLPNCKQDASQKFVYFPPLSENDEKCSRNEGDDRSEPPDIPLPRSQSESQDDDSQVVLQPVRRTTRQRKSPMRYPGTITGDWHKRKNHEGNADCASTVTLIKASDVEEPKSLHEAMQSKFSEQWKCACDSEYESLLKNKTFELVPLPPGKNVVNNGWVFKAKPDANGNVSRFKARLVAKGFTQEYGIDYEEIYAPVAHDRSIKTILSLVNAMDLELHQMDVKTAFLNGELDTEIFMRQPEGYVDPNNPDLVCRLNKGLYGLKQAARCWNVAIDNYLKSIGYKSTNADPCVYTKQENRKLMILCLYVDDILLASNDKCWLESEKKVLKDGFEMVDQGEAHYILGMNIFRNKKERILFVNQTRYIQEILRRFGMGEENRPTSTPMDPNQSFRPCESEHERFHDVQLYKSAIGALTYVMSSTRPDLCASVGALARFSDNPTKEHWTAVKRILRYLRKTVDYGIQFGGKKETEKKVELKAFCDASWAGDIESRKSTSGFLIQLCDGPISWKNKRQDVVALSSTEAEYIAISFATQEIMWLRSFLNELGFPQKGPTVICEDNLNAIAIAKNPIACRRTKHIDVRYHYIREKVNENKISLQYCSTNDMLADILTKGLAKQKFENFRSQIGVRSSV